MEEITGEITDQSAKNKECSTPHRTIISIPYHRDSGNNLEEEVEKIQEPEEEGGTWKSCLLDMTWLPHSRADVTAVMVNCIKLS